jgi:hypothetical protein
MLFSGDSFTPAGIDDYCMYNRNWLGQGLGFGRCIELIQKLQPTDIFNCHVAESFDFTDEECQFISTNLAEREKLFGELVPWDNVNYGMDEPWVRCFPYEQKGRSGQKVTVEVVVTNHSSLLQKVSCRLILPGALNGKGTIPVWTKADLNDWSSIKIPAMSDGRIRLSFTIPAGVKSGRYVIPVDLQYSHWNLPQFTEAIVEI